MSQKGYLFAELSIADPDMFYGQYMLKVKPVLEEFGARFLIGTNSPQVVEGKRSVQRVILVEFPSVEVARTFYYSPDYQDIINYRFQSSSAHLYILDGL